MTTIGINSSSFETNILHIVKPPKQIYVCIFTLQNSENHFGPGPTHKYKHMD